MMYIYLVTVMEVLIQRFHSRHINYTKIDHYGQNKLPSAYFVCLSQIM